MPSCTEENLDKLLKKALIAIIPAMQSRLSVANAEGLEEISKLKSEIDLV